MVAGARDDILPASADELEVTNSEIMSCTQNEKKVPSGQQMQKLIRDGMGVL
jgi:hypothetical protein